MNNSSSTSTCWADDVVECPIEPRRERRPRVRIAVPIATSMDAAWTGIPAARIDEIEKYLVSFGPPAKQMRQSLLKAVGEWPNTKQSLFVEIMVEKSNSIRSPHAIDDAVDFISHVDPAVLLQAYRRAVPGAAAESAISVYVPAIARSGLSIANKLGLLKSLLRYDAPAIRETAVCALGELTDDAEAINILKMVANSDEDAEVRDEAQSILDDL